MTHAHDHAGPRLAGGGLYRKAWWLVASVLLGVGLCLAIVLYATELSEVRAHGGDAARVASHAAVETIYAAMRAGGGVREMDDAIARLQRGLPDLQIHVTRGEAVVRQFGPRVETRPHGQLVPNAPREPRVLLAAWAPSVATPAVVYTSTPLLFEQECLRCHAAPLHAQAGLVTIDFSLAGLERIHHQRWLAVGIVLAAGLLAAGVVAFHGVRRMLIRPIETIGHGLNEIARGNLAHRIQAATGDELEALAQHVNDMAQRLQELHDEESRAAIAVERASQNERYRGLYEGVPVGLLRTTPDGRFLDVNQAFVDMLGYPDRDSLLAVRVTDHYVDPRDRASWQAVVERTDSTNEREFRMRRFDGSEIWVRGGVRVARDGGGRVVHYEAYLFDVTRRREAETRAIEIGTHLQEIMATVPEGIVVVDEAHRLVLANLAAQSLMLELSSLPPGGMVSHLAGRPIEGLLEPPADGVAREVELPGSPPRVLEIIAHPVERDRGGWVLWTRDVTRDREMRSHAATQDRLAAIGQLAAGIAHDFNNVLQGVIGHAGLLRMQTDLPESVQEPLDIISEQGERAAQMIRQVLDFSRRSPSQRNPLQLTELAKEILKLLVRAVPENIAIVTSFGPGTHRVAADVTQLHQVLTNLIINARDAMPEGGRLEVSVASGPPPPGPDVPPGEWVLLRVADSGTGIPAEIRARIFEPFFTTKAAGRGTGLGLAQVYGIVKQHDGYIDVESEPGRGSTFTVYLPRLLDEETAAARGVSRPLGHAHGETVLLVEDERTVSEVTRRMLQAFGYRVLSARNGREALEVYERHAGEIAVLLTDMVMPEMGGRQLIQAVHERGQGVPVVVMSGYPLHDDWSTICGAGGVSWLQKPVGLESLATAMEGALSARKAP